MRVIRFKYVCGCMLCMYACYDEGCDDITDLPGKKARQRRRMSSPTTPASASVNREALNLIKQAEQAASYKGWFGANKLDDAADLYGRAANAFKLSKNC